MLHVPRLKGYIEVSGLIRGEVVVKRLAVYSPRFDSNTPQMEDVLRRVKEYLQAERGSPIKVIVKNLVIKDGVFTLVHEGTSLRGKGLSGEAVLGTGGVPVPNLTISLKELSTTMSGWPDLRTGLKGSLSLGRDMIEVKDIAIDFLGSAMHVSGGFPIKEDREDGEHTSAGQGNKGLQVRLKLLMESLKETFGLKGSGEGEVHAKGQLHFREGMGGIQNPDMDIEVNGGLYIQTLMELLQVRERIEGHVDFKGTLKGPLRDLKGHAKATMKAGNMLGIALDDLTCDVSYSDGWLRFGEGKASLYNGHADASFSLRVYGTQFYKAHLGFSEVDSPAAFKFIGWVPGYRRGR